MGPNLHTPECAAGCLQEAAGLQGRCLVAVPRGIGYLWEQRMLSVRDDEDLQGVRTHRLAVPAQTGDRLGCCATCLNALQRQWVASFVQVPTLLQTPFSYKCELFLPGGCHHFLLQFSLGFLAV